MKKFTVAIILASLLLLVPFQTYAGSPYDPAVLSQWAGCTATVVTNNRVSVDNSMYSPYEHTVYIGTAPGVPQYVRTIIIFHEVGHCLQRQTGFDLYNDRVITELDADRIAADLACRYGMDGKQMLHDIFVWAKETFGYDGDAGHGTLVQRISQGELAEACQVIPIQAP